MKKSLQSNQINICWGNLCANTKGRVAVAIAFAFCLMLLMIGYSYVKRAS